MLDVSTLRRVALLVMRARDDASPGAVHDELAKIGPVIERMKRSVAIGSPFATNDVMSLFMLVKRLPRAGSAHSASEIVQASTISELRDLVTRVDRS